MTAGSLIARALTRAEFADFQRFIYAHAGITMSDAKQALVAGRLNKRLRYFGMSSYDEYYRFINEAAATDEQVKERQIAIDLLTTNETYFFREAKHFEYLQHHILPEWQASTGTRRIWSAACSSGEEAYTLAMVCAEYSPSTIEIVGTDISQRVLEQAQQGIYPLMKSERIPDTYLKKYCLRGTNRMAGFMQIKKELRERVRFTQANLQEAQTQRGKFDLILLRNVMIYFNAETKSRVLRHVCNQLAPGGRLMIGHSESLHGLYDGLNTEQTAIYRLCE